MRKLIGLIALGLCLTSCGKEETAAEETAAEETAVEETAVEEASALTGTWLRACEDDTDDDESEQESMVFDGTDLTLSINMYEGLGCTAASISSAITIGATVSIGEDVDGLDGVKQMDITFNTMTLTPKSAGAVTHLNEGSKCGKSDWALNTAADVLGCEDMGGVTAGLTLLDIYKIDDTTLTFGKDKDSDGNEIDTTTTRPTELNESQYNYTKQ